MSKEIKTEQISFYSALITARIAVQSFTKNTKGHNYSYADLPTLLEAVIDPLAENNIFVNSIISPENQELLEVRLTYALTGESISTYVPLIGIFAPKDAGDRLTLMQRFGSTLTYAQRYGIQSILGLSAEKDDDAASASHVHSKKPTMPPPLAPSNKGMPFSKSLPPVKPKVEVASNQDHIDEITHLWDLKKEICMNQDPVRGEKIMKHLDNLFMGVPADSLLKMRDYLKDLKEVITSVSLEEAITEFAA